LAFGDGEELLQVRAEVFEGPPGVGVALAMAAAVGVIVQGPALVVDMLVGVVVPLLEDVGGGAGVDGELVQDQLSGSGIDRSWAFSAGRTGRRGAQRRAGAAAGAVPGGLGAQAASAAVAVRCLWAAAQTVSSR
jgi:hypothetical protein